MNLVAWKTGASGGQQPRRPWWARPRDGRRLTAGLPAATRHAPEVVRGDRLLLHPCLILQKDGRWFWIALIALTGLAFLLRLYHLDSFPLGLFWDEAFEGLEAYALFGKSFWHWPLFFTEINGREPLFVYLVHLAQRLWGPSTWSVRVVSATAGALLTPALIWLGWEMAPSLGVNRRKQFALWTGLAVLALLWSQTVARLGQRISLYALLEILFLAALWRAWRRPARRWWIIAGGFAGLSFYTYLAVRVIPTLLGLMVGYALLLRRAELRSRWAGIAIGLAAALIVAAPLLIHFACHPGDFSMRTSQITILTQAGIAALPDNLGAVLGMAFVRGDLNDRLNYPGRPVLDALTLVPFLVGLYLILRRCRQPAYFFLLAGLGCLLLPTLLSTDAPNFGRAIGALPIFVLLIALGLDQLLTWATQWHPALQAPGSMAGWALLFLSVALTAHVYYVQYAKYPPLSSTWDTGFTQVAYDSATGSGARIYVETAILDHPALPYLLSGQPIAKLPHSMDTCNRCLRAALDGPARYYLRADAETRWANLLQSYLPDSRRRAILSGSGDKPWANIIEQPAGGRVQFPELQPLPRSFQDGIGLVGYWLSQATTSSGDHLYVRLLWQVTTPPTESYTVFVHLSQAGQVTAGADDLPGHGACKTSDWQPGEVIVNEMQVVLPPDMPDGVYDLAVGLYRLETMQRLEATGNADNQVMLGSLRKDHSAIHWLVLN